VALGHARELLDPRLLGESDDPEVRLVNAEQRRGLLSDSRFVVGRAGAVRRPHLTQPGAGARQNLGNAKSVADLDQLAAGDDHLVLRT
jgi:hypothetical protein